MTRQVTAYTDTTRVRRFRSRHGDAMKFISALSAGRWWFAGSYFAWPGKHSVYGVANRYRRSRIKAFEVDSAWVWVVRGGRQK